MIDGWKKVFVEDICTKGSSNIAQNKIEDNHGDYPLYGASGFIKRIDFFHQEKPYVGIVKDGSGVGRVDFYPAKSSLLGTLQYILPKPGYDFRFVGYALKSINLASFATGAAIPHIYFKDYCKSVICVPGTIDEQHRVVDELNLLNDIIVKKNQQLCNLDSLSQSLFCETFGDPSTNNKGFKETTLGELCDVITKGTTPSSLGFSFVDEGINFLKVESFNTDETINKSKITHITKECDLALKRSRLMENDILMCIAGATCGRLAVVPAKVLPANTNQAFGIIRLKNKSNMFHRYIYSYLHTLYIRNCVNELMKGVAQPNLTLAHLRGFKILLPPESLYGRFAQQMNAIEVQKRMIRQSLTEMASLMNSRLNYYFSD